jgi:hypothetical protein
VDTNVSYQVPPEDVDELLERFAPFEMPDPPSVQGVCSRCGYHGKVYPGRYGGYRCAVLRRAVWLDATRVNSVMRFPVGRG